MQFPGFFPIDFCKEKESAYMKRGPMNSTIYDVSRLSGVSIATVSRAFSNPDRVRESTRRKVFEAAEVLHYSPNAIAQAMARQRTDKIAFLICKEGASILDEFYAGICNGIMGETNRTDYELVISTAADWDMAANTSKNKQVEGVILGGNARPDMISELQSRNLAVVLVNNRISGLDIPCVVSDEYGGVRLALEHLISRGHQNIAMLAGRFSPYILGERYRAFLEITQAHGLAADARHIKLCDPTVESAAAACQELLSHPDRPTAIFAANDVLAAGAMKAARRMGLRIPDDLAVTGLDDSSACGMLEPELTSVHIDCHRMGELSVARLQALLAGDQDVPPVTVVPAELRVRGSS